MRNYIILNDQNSNDISGLLIQSLAPISKPLMRTEIEEIDGRDGDITTKLGYSAYDKQITIGLFGNYDVDQVIAFFNSEGTAIFSNEPDKYYNYQIVDQIDFERLVRYKTATVTMHCQPFKYSTTEGADILSSSDNFATLNQSLNTDSSFYTYSSNVQADITATRQSGTGGKFFAVFTVPVVQGVTYHFSGNVSRNVSMYGYTDQLRGTSAGIAGKGFSGNFVYTATFTGTMVLGFYSNATTEIFIRNFAISNEAGSTVSDEGTNLVLEGSALAPFSQFDLKGNTDQNGTPTPDAPVPVKVVTGENVVQICAKNLFDLGDSLDDYFLTSGDGTTIQNEPASLRVGATFTPNSMTIDSYNTSGWRWLSKWVVLKKNTDYIMTATSHHQAIRVVGFNSKAVGTTGTIIKIFARGGEAATFNSGNYDYYLVSIYPGEAGNVFSEIQLELGSSASSFESYQGQSYPISLGSIELCGLGDYQDYIYKSGGKWYVHKEMGKIIQDGSVQVNYYDAPSVAMANDSLTAYFSLYGYGNYVNGIDYKSNMFGTPYERASAIWGSASQPASDFRYEGMVKDGSALRVRILKSRLTGWSDSLSATDKANLMKTWLNNNTPIVYGALTTPTDTEITNEALVGQLDEIDSHAHAYKERTHISSTYAEGNVPHIIAAAVTGDADGTVTNSGNIYSKPKLTIFGTGDIGVYLNGVQMFQIALGTSGYITIDTALMEAYQDNLQTLMNRQVTGDYSNFVLNPGENTISFTGSVSMCVVENYSRWL